MGHGCINASENTYCVMKLSLLTSISSKQNPNSSPNHRVYTDYFIYYVCPNCKNKILTLAQTTDSRIYTDYFIGYICPNYSCLKSKQHLWRINVECQVLNHYRLIPSWFAYEARTAKAQSQRLQCVTCYCMELMGQLWTLRIGMKR